MPSCRSIGGVFKRKSREMCVSMFFVFILLTITGLRQYIVNAIPLVLRRAISPGIGLFIAFVGLQSAGIVKSSEATVITLGDLHSPGVLLAMFGILLTAALMVKKVTGASPTIAASFPLHRQ